MTTKKEVATSKVVKSTKLSQPALPKVKITNKPGAKKTPPSKIKVPKENDPTPLKTKMVKAPESNKPASHRIQASKTTKRKYPAPSKTQKQIITVINSISPPQYQETETTRYLLLQSKGDANLVSHPLLKEKLRHPIPLTKPVEESPKQNFVAGYRHFHQHAKQVAINYASHASKRISSTPTPTQIDHYYSVADAAIDSKYSETQLLEYASEDEIKLCLPIPDGIILRPFDKDTESIGSYPGFLTSPDKLILDPMYCTQIKDNRDHKTEQCNFRKVYILSFGKPKMLLPSYANPAFLKSSCVWHVFKEGKSFIIEIKQEDILVAKDELQSFIRRNPKQPEPKTTTPPVSVAKDKAKVKKKAPTLKFIGAIQELLEAISKKMSGKELTLNKNRMPGKKEHFRELALKFEPKYFSLAESTFNDYIEGICKFPQGRHKANEANFYAELFPELYNK